MMQTFKALIIGYGSIGQRHTRLLAELGCQVAVLSRRELSGYERYADLASALNHFCPDYVVLAHKTHEHAHTLANLVEQDFHGRVLVEKPLFHELQQIPQHHFSRAAVAYNLRFHPVLQRLKSMLTQLGRVHFAQISVGSYLPNWRPESDYRQSYSAKKAEGGGVLRDLSHELDYAFWFFGPWQQLTASGGKFSNLDIETDDTYALLLSTKVCPLLTIQLNYLERVPRREIVVHTEQGTICADLVKNSIKVNGHEEMIPTERDTTYRLQHQAMLSENVSGLCTLEEGLETLRTIEAAERAARSKTWVIR